MEFPNMKDTREILTVRDCAEMLQCSLAHMWKIVDKGEIKSSNIAVDGKRNRQLRILKADLIDWFKTQPDGGINEK